MVTSEGADNVQMQASKLQASQLFLSFFTVERDYENPRSNFQVMRLLCIHLFMTAVYQYCVLYSAGLDTFQCFLFTNIIVCPHANDFVVECFLYLGSAQLKNFLF